jgi:hypothetical protein
VTTEAQIFVALASSQGFAAATAEAALAAVTARLAGRGEAPRRYFCFRSAGGGGRAGGPAPARPRVLLLFPSADDALGFAQGRGIARSPRLMTLSLAQALAALLQRPAIGALLVADRAADGATEGGAAGLPPGLRLERAELLAMLGADGP